MTWPATLTKTHLDAGTDDPKQARGELESAVDAINAIIAQFTGKAAVIETRAALAAATVASDIDAIFTTGYTTAGDGGGTLYKRVGSQPGHPLKVQSADLAWWEIAPVNGVVPFQAAGAIEGDSAGNGATNVTAFDDFIAYAQDGATTFADAPTLYLNGHFHFNDHLNVKAGIRILGRNGFARSGAEGSILEFPANNHGIIVQRSNTIDDTTATATFGADGTVISNVYVKGGGNTGTTGQGIWLRARALIRDVYISDFSENGVNIVATAGGGGASEGNANNWRIEAVKVESCHGSGLFVDGADVNAGYCESLDVTNCGRWGVYDSSFLGNTYIAPHTSANGLASLGGNGSGESSRVHLSGTIYYAHVGATEANLVATTPGTDETIWVSDGAGSGGPQVPTWTAAQPTGTYFHGGPYRTDNANAHSVFLGGYIEGNQNPAQYVKPTLILGGFNFDQRGDAYGIVGGVIRGDLDIRNHDLWASSRDITLELSPSANKMLKFRVDGDHASGLNFFSWDNASGLVMAFEHANSASRRPLQISTDLYTGQHGTGAAIGGGQALMPQGIFLGGNAKGRRITQDSAPPSTGAHGVGERVFNNAATGPVGWKCRTSGTPGTWEAFGVEAKAGTDTIADTASTQAVTFATAFPSANYAVTVAADGDERVWISSKATTGFTLNRAGTSGARAVDWTATIHLDP